MHWLALNHLYYLLIIPIIILFYLLKRKYEEKEISSTLLWEKMLRDLEANRPWQKLRRNLLLLLQLLIAGLLIIALLKPALPANAINAHHIILVIDNSGSMQTIEQGISRLDQAKKKALDVIDALGNNQLVSIIEMGNTSKLLLNNSSDKKALKESIDLIKERFGESDELAAFSLAQTIAKKDDKNQIIWLSDGANSSLMQQRLVMDESTDFIHYQMGKTSENIAITTFVTEKKKDQSVGFIQIKNHGIETKEVTLTIDNYQGVMIDFIQIKVNGNDDFIYQTEHLPLSQAYKAEIEVKDDGLLADNLLWSVPYEDQQINGMLISPEGNHFLSQALKASNSLQLNKMGSLPNQMDEAADIWIYDRVLPHQLPKGNILIIAPHQSTDWLTYKGEREVENRLQVNNHEHPLLKYTDWKEIYIAKLQMIDPLASMETIVESGGQPILMAGTIQDRKAVILTFDLHQSDFPLHTTFPIFIQNTVKWLLPEPALPIADGYAGQQINIPFVLDADDKVITTPSGKKITVETKGTFIPFQVPEELGLYHLEEKHGENSITRLFTVKMSEKESQIKSNQIQVVKLSDEEQENKVSEISYKNIAEWFLVMALFVSFVEWGVYHRGY